MIGRLLTKALELHRTVRGGLTAEDGRLEDLWDPVGFDTFEDVPFHHRPLDRADREVVAVFNDRGGLHYFHKPSTDQFWVVIGKEGGKCPVERCGAECCTTGAPWPAGVFSPAPTPCPFLSPDLECAIQQSKFMCCVLAPAPWNGMENLPLCELRTVEARPRWHTQ